MSKSENMKCINAICANCGELLYEGKTRRPYDSDIQRTDFRYTLLCRETGCDIRFKLTRDDEENFWVGPFNCLVPNTIAGVHEDYATIWTSNKTIHRSIHKSKSVFIPPSRVDWLNHYCEFKRGKYYYIGTGHTYPYKKYEKEEECD